MSSPKSHPFRYLAMMLFLILSMGLVNGCFIKTKEVVKDKSSEERTDTEHHDTEHHDHD